MKKLTLFAATLLGACAPTVITPPSVNARASAPVEDYDGLDTRIEELMAANDVKGMAIAIIDGEEVRHVRAFGHANVEKQVPLETDTIMYAASITKAAFTYMVLQLVDEGRIGLDTPISEYLAKPLPEYSDEDRGDWSSLQGDEDWRLLTPRMLLNHSSGLANLRWLEPDHDMSFHFTPGTAYAYSGEGFYLLQFVLEQGLGLNVKDEMQRRIFDRFGMPDTSMQWREDFASHLADGYRFDGTFEPHDARSGVSASGSMDTTIADQARMWRGMLIGEGLSPEMRAEWTRPEVPISTKSKFPTIKVLGTYDPIGPRVHLAGGLGVDTWEGPSGRFFAKGGHNEWTGNIAQCDEANKRCVVLLGNDVRAELIYPAIVTMVLGNTRYPWAWTYPELFGR
ncbi:serine hydrolase domain-containing protein [Pseudoblastomonas halimionae]|uniref:Serine hydrolase n=1 Tax=Alteriqipengyuania halimionae TaxID=1926630 RepID=A0A6I4U2T7_9SPHN|nr:serine hydrolase domain-containing protein [Alteriqipengyuania halimionae]MXP10340.1 serine hydrolase [Alteriqipengyuania halimionae]